MGFGRGSRELKMHVIVQTEKKAAIQYFALRNVDMVVSCIIEIPRQSVKGIKPRRSITDETENQAIDGHPA